MKDTWGSTSIAVETVVVIAVLGVGCFIYMIFKKKFICKKSSLLPRQRKYSAHPATGIEDHFASGAASLRD